MFVKIAVRFQSITNSCRACSIMSEEEEVEVVDQLAGLREECTEAHCTKYKAALDACNERVSGKENTAETCSDEMVDFMHCVDHCAMPKLFKVLK